MISKTESILERFRQHYPREYDAFSKADSDEAIMELQERFLSESKEKLKQLICQSGLDEKRKQIILQDDSETVAVVIRESLYSQLTNARGDEIQTQLVELFDGIERLKDMGNQDTEVMAYALSNAGLAALGFAMSVQLIIDVMVGMGVDSAVVAALETISLVAVGVVIDLIVLSIIPILYFMSKPAACIFVVINNLDVNLEIQEEDIIHGKVNVRTKCIPAARTIKSTIRSGGIWSSQKKDAALIGTQYGVTLKQTKGEIETAEPDDTIFAIGVECPLADGDNSCAVGINKTASAIGEEVDKHRKQEVMEQNDTYKIEMWCNSGSGSVAYYICRITKK